MTDTFDNAIEENKEFRYGLELYKDICFSMVDKGTKDFQRQFKEYIVKPKNKSRTQKQRNFY